MTQIENIEYKIGLLEREQRYLQEDIEDLRERIEEEKQVNEMYMED